MTTVDEMLNCIYSKRWSHSPLPPNRQNLLENSDFDNAEVTTAVEAVSRTNGTGAKLKKVSENSSVEIIDCDALILPYMSGEMIDSLVVKDEIDLAIEIESSDSNDSGTPEEPYHSDQVDNFSRNQDSLDLRNSLINVKATAGVEAETCIDAEKNSDSDRVLSNEAKSSDWKITPEDEMIMSVDPEDAMMTPQLLPNNI